MLEDAVLYVSRTIAHLASILLMLLPLPIFLADPQELVLLPGKIEGTDPCGFEKIAHLLLIRAVELEFAQLYWEPHSFLPKHRQASASQPLHTDEWQREVILVDDAEHVEPFRADRSELLVLVALPIEQFLEVQELLVDPEGMYCDTVTAKGLLLSETVSDGDLEHTA